MIASYKSLGRRLWIGTSLALAMLVALNSNRAVRAEDAPRLKLEKGDHVVLIGNTLAERLQYFGNWETLLHSRFPELNLVVRNLGFSADELALRPRSADFKDHGATLEGQKADVVIAFFGFNESFGGKDKLPQFEKELEAFIAETTSTNYNDKNPPRLALVSPIAHENLNQRGVTDGKANNANIKLYTEAMKKIAAKHNLPVVDLFTPTQKLMETSSSQPLTFNGIHLNESGDATVSKLLDEGLFGARAADSKSIDLAKLRAEVNEKNQQFFYDHRAVNGYYIYGKRKTPFGVVNFPEEFKKLRKMTDNRDRRVWAVAQGQSVPAEIDDSDTGAMPDIATNFRGRIPPVISPEQAKATFKLPEGYEINLYASEIDFPDLVEPVQMTFDTKGRLWVCTIPSYPHAIPGVPPNDKVLILEDTNADGRADSCKVFADKLYLPIGLELGFNKVFVSQEPNIMAMQDTNGDDRADKRDLILHGFDSGDSHHAAHTFVWDPGMALYFQEGTFMHTQIETPYGPVRSHNAAVFRFEPRTWKLDNYVSYRFANPWGHYFDRWGQDFVADASGGANYFAGMFSGSVDYPNKHRNIEERYHLLKKVYRPTAGCELVSSRNFPDEVQDNYLLNNCITFLGTLQHKLRDDGSGFHADRIDDQLQSSDPNFRPVDLEFGPDGALYIVDWYNPLIGHMQHSIRDPNRDKKIGRIWRITYKDRPLVQPAKIAGEPIPALLDLLKTYENRTRYRVRIELSGRAMEDVMPALDKWISGLDKNDSEYQHHLLEALWVRQMHDVVDEKLLRMMLKSPDYRARAAATRVLCYWRDRVDSPLALLEQLVGDEHPRVRLEAVRALSFFTGKDADPARTIAALSLAQPQDPYLEYTYKETDDVLEKRAQGVDPLAAQKSRTRKLNDYVTNPR